MLFLGIISWRGTSRFNGGGIIFQMGEASFLSVGGAPWGGIGFDGGAGSKKIAGWGGVPPLWETLKPFIKKCLLEEMEGVNDNFSAFMHLNMKINK